MELTLYQVIAILNKLETKDKQFYRVGDKDFKIVKGSLGDVMCKLDNSTNDVGLNKVNNSIKSVS